MLRRAPTLITLTPEDVAAYEDSRNARLAQESSPGDNNSFGFSDAANRSSKSNPTLDPNDELRPHPGDKTKAARHGAVIGPQGNGGSGNEGSPSVARTRSERIGLGQ